MNEHSFIAGGIPRPTDTRDYILGASSLPPTILFEDTTMLPIHYQGQTPACGAHAFAWYLQYLHWKKTGEIRKFTPRFNWIRLKQQDGFPLEVGTDLRSIFKFEYQKDGADDFEPLENNIDLNLQDYSAPKFLTADMVANAKQNLGGDYAFEDKPSFQRIQELLNEKGALIALVSIGDGWWLPSWADKATNPVTLGNYVGHHFIVFHRPKEGQDPNLLHFANSFGEPWGNAGHGVMDKNYAKYILEVGSAVDPVLVIPSETPAQSTQTQEVLTLQQQVVNLAGRLITLLKQKLGFK